MFDTIKNPICGYNPVAGTGGPLDDMPIDAGYLKLTPRQTYPIFSEAGETAVLLLSGSVEFSWEGNRARVQRPDSFDFPPTCLHLPRGTEAAVKALTDAELFVMQTANGRNFPSRLYTPEETANVRAGRTEMNGCARRDIRTVFDYSNAPHSNLVVGEVVSHPGRWSSYPPHHHPQPELYFYRFDKPQGFGACFIGEDVYKIRHLSWAAIPGGRTHPQAAAPGYALHYVWAIRHLPGNPWKATRIGVPEHDWLLEGGGGIWNPQD